MHLPHAVAVGRSTNSHYLYSIVIVPPAFVALITMPGLMTNSFFSSFAFYENKQRDHYYIKIAAFIIFMRIFGIITKSRA